MSGLTPCLCERGIRGGLHRHGSVAHCRRREVREARLASHRLSCWAASITERVLDHSLWQEKRDGGELKQAAMEQAVAAGKHTPQSLSDSMLVSPVDPQARQRCQTVGIKGERRRRSDRISKDNSEVSKVTGVPQTMNLACSCRFSS